MKNLFNDYWLQYLHTFLYSPFDSYYCNQGCSVCYLKDSWITKNSRSYKLPDARTLEFFSYFDPILVDDLSYAKNKYPEIYDYIKSNTNLFHSPPTTDKGFINLAKLILEDNLSFKSIYQITLTPKFLNKSSINLVKALSANNKIRQIILLDFYSLDNLYYLTELESICDNIIARPIFKLEDPNATSYQPYNYAYNVVDSFMMFKDKFYLNYQDSIYNRNYCVDFTLDIPQLITNLTRLLLNRYTQYPINNISKLNVVLDRWRNYSINTDWTYIPYNMLNPAFMTDKLKDLFDLSPMYFLLKDSNKLQPIIRGKTC